MTTRKVGSHDVNTAPTPESVFQVINSSDDSEMHALVPHHPGRWPGPERAGFLTIGKISTCCDICWRYCSHHWVRHPSPLYTVLGFSPTY